MSYYISTDIGLSIYQYPDSKQIVFDISNKDLASLSNGLGMLNSSAGKSMNLKINRSYNFRMQCPAYIAPGYSTVKISNRDVLMMISSVEAEMLQHFVDRAVLEKAADVDHVDIEALEGEVPVQITFRFPVFGAPMSPEEAEKLMSRD